MIIPLTIQCLLMFLPQWSCGIKTLSKAMPVISRQWYYTHAHTQGVVGAGWTIHTCACMYVQHSQYQPAQWYLNDCLLSRERKEVYCIKVKLGWWFRDCVLCAYGTYFTTDPKKSWHISLNVQTGIDNNHVCVCVCVRFKRLQPQ